jgi:hypothetical protein
MTDTQIDRERERDTDRMYTKRQIYGKTEGLNKEQTIQYMHRQTDRRMDISMDGRTV